LLPVTDAAILAAGADGAILISRHGKTTRDQVATAVGRLESVEARLVGTVANWTPARRNPYGYSYGYAPEVGRSKKERNKRQSPQITVDSRFPALLERDERVSKPEPAPRLRKQLRPEAPPAVIPKGTGNHGPRGN
jgi:hypothetical protein